MPTRHGSNLPKNSSILPRLSCFAISENRLVESINAVHLKNGLGRAPSTSSFAVEVPQSATKAKRLWQRGGTTRYTHRR